MSRTTITPERRLAVRSEQPELSAAGNGSDTIIPFEAAAGLTGALRRHWLVVVGCVILSVAAALVVTATTDKKYDATAKVVVNNAEPIDVVQQSASTRSLDPERDLNTWVRLVTVNEVARPVSAKLGLSMTVPQLLDEVSASPEGNSNVIAIKARDSYPSRAAAIANAFADQYVVFRRDSARALYGQAARSAEDRLAALTPRARRLPIGRDLNRSANDLAVASTVQTGGVRVVDRALAPTSAATPRTRFTVTVAALLGLALGALFAFALDRRRLS